MAGLIARGRLRVYATFADAAPELLIDTRNLIVDLGLDALAALLGVSGSPAVGGLSVLDPSGPAIGYMYLGVASPAVTPVAGDTVPLPDPITGLATAPTFSFAVSNGTLSVSYPNAATVSFVGTIPANAWNAPNDPISDEAILTNMGTLFARVALPAGVNTTLSQGRSFVHDITFSRI